jgi:soluble lytic murein transglycosylase
VSSAPRADVRGRAAPAAPAAARRASPTHRRRRLGAIVGVALAVAGLVALLAPAVHHAVNELALPLRHDDIIRQQAAADHLDPALIAAVIDTESHFRDQTSAAGARGLMQITPDTATYIEHLSGGTTFTLADLSTPQVNISYGAYYLRYLINRYGGNERLALAAYNAGDANVDRWLAQARAAGHLLTLADIPFAETRAYVQTVESAKTAYRRAYPSELRLR